MSDLNRKRIIQTPLTCSSKMNNGDSSLGEAKQRLLIEVERLFSDLADIDVVKKAVLNALNSGASPLDVIDAMSSGLEIVGSRYERGEYFLSELIMAGVISSEVSSLLKPHLEGSAVKPIAKVVIGTIKGDLHDIGKNIVAMMLSSAGFEVVDLGVDVPSERFIESIRKEKPDIVGMSCLLTIAIDEMKNAVKEIEEAGLREKVKVLVGGRPLTMEIAKEIGADAYASNASEAVRVAKSLIQAI